MNAIIATTTIIANLITKDGITIKLFKGKIPKVGDKLYITGTKPYLIAKRGKSDMIFYTVLSLEDNLTCKDEFYLKKELMPKTTYTEIYAVRYIKKYVDIVRKSNQHWEESKTMYYLMEGEKLVCKCHKTAVIPYYIEKLNEAIMFVFNIHKFDKPEVERMSINDLRELAGENKSVRYYGIKSILKNIKKKNFDFSESWVRLDYDTYPKGEIVLFYEYKTEIVPKDLEWTIDEKTAEVSRNEKGEMIVNYQNHTEIYSFSDFEDKINTQKIETFHDVTTVKINLNYEQE